MRLNVIGFALGVWLLQVQPQLPVPAWFWWTPVLMLLGVSVVAAQSVTARALRRGVAFVCCIGCGFTWAAWFAQQRLADELPAAWEGQDLELIGVVASLPQQYERSLRFEFDVERVLTPGAKVPSHIVLSWWGSPARDERPATFPELHAGERWQLKARLRRPHGTVNPHGFDYEAWLLERNIRATGYIRPGGGNRRLAGLVLQPSYAVERVREAARDRIQAALPDAPYAGVLAALAIGDQRAIPQSQWQIFTRTGINHLMSISGLHVTMISGLVFALAGWLWRRSSRLALWLPARKAATVCGLAAALAYAWLSGFAVPAQRTVYMIAVVAVALWLGRVGSASVVLAAALLVVLLVDPWAVLAPGFWLSFGAVALILFVAAGRIGRPHWLAAWVKVQWAVTLGLIPLLLALFQQVSLVSPFANAFAIPVVSLIVVPLTLVGLVLPFDLVLQLAHLVMTLCMVVLEWMSALPAAVWQQHAPVGWAVAVALAGILWLLLPRGFPARWIGAGALAPMFLVLPPQMPHGTLALTVLDVGQGVAIVARTRDHALLYDAGPAFGPEADSGNRIIVPFLRATGVRGLSGMVISHDDVDHSGGAASVLQALPVGWVSSSLLESHPLLAQGANAHRCAAGQSWQWDGVDFEVLYPSAANYLNGKFKDNDRGCVLKVAVGEVGVLLSADNEQKTERELLSNVPAKLPTQVMLVPHHGSRNSSSEAFVQNVNPDIALISVGYRNRFGHPKEDVLERYQALGTRIYRTDRDGALLLEISGNGAIRIERARAVYRRYWHALLVNPTMLDDEPE